MKTCPYCAEEIKDAAIKCRWCGSWLVDEVPPGADGLRVKPAGSGRAPEPEEPDKVSEPAPAAEPAPAEAPEPASGSASVPAAAQAPTAQPAAATTVPAAQPAAAEAKVEFTHTGSRYLLGYGGDYFGIWDRNAPQQAVERFPRNDQGWASAWQRYSSIENNWLDLRTGQKSG